MRMRLVFWISLATESARQRQKQTEFEAAYLFTHIRKKKSIPIFDHTYFAQGFKHNYFTKLYYRSRNMVNGLYSSKAIVAHIQSQQPAAWMQIQYMQLTDCEQLDLIFELPALKTSKIHTAFLLVRKSYHYVLIKLIQIF